MNILYGSFSYPHQERIAEILHSERGWNPAYWLANGPRHILERFPDTVLHDHYEARRGIFPVKIDQQVAKPLDEKLLMALAPYELNFYNILDRSDADGRSFSFRERQALYYKSLYRWNYILDKFSINAFISWCTVHGSDDYPLYLLCKIRGIPTIMMDSSPLFGKYHTICFSAHQRSLQFERAYREKKKTIQDPDTLDYIRRVRGEYSGAIPDYMKRDRKKRNGASIFFKYLGEFWKSFANRPLATLHSYLKNHPLKSARFHMKANTHPVESDKSDFSTLGLYLYKGSGRKKIRELRRYYESICEKDIDRSKPYIYFAANYQPEATTVPNAGYYVNLHLIVNILSRAIPSDWLIYYKEHPTTFWETAEGFRNRDQQYYATLKEFENVRLISSEMNAFDLMDGCRAVATATGVSAWEALLRGKPAMIFGSVWFSGCNSIFKIHSFDDAVAAVESIRDGYRPDPADVERFIAAVEHTAHKDLIVRNYPDRMAAAGNREIELRKLANAFSRGYDAYLQLTDASKTLI